MQTDLLHMLFFGAILPVPLSIILLAVGLFYSNRIPERRIHQLMAMSMSTSLLLTTALLVPLIAGWIDPIEMDLGAIVAVRGYSFDLAFELNRDGVIFLWLDFALCGLVGAFSSNYLHREEGYNRFYFLLMVFVLGLEIISVAQGLDMIFAGWELLGLSSTLLIAYFYRRPGPVENGLRAYKVYRTTDVGLLLSLVLIHHHLGTTSLDALGQLTGPSALLIGGLLIFGAMGKGAIAPFTPWLPRAMEGPTTSSAIFYGALSVHASPFLLIRVRSLLESDPRLMSVIVALGLITAVHATTVGRTQTDIKTSLGYACVAQVGLIWVEIGLGFHTLAMAHIVGHAILRTWQFLRSPSVLLDRQVLARAMGHNPNPTGHYFEKYLPAFVRRWTYRIALERWYLDELNVVIGRVFMSPFDLINAASEWLETKIETDPSEDVVSEVLEQ